MFAQSVDQQNACHSIECVSRMRGRMCNAICRFDFIFYLLVLMYCKYSCGRVVYYYNGRTKVQTLAASTTIDKTHGSFMPHVPRLASHPPFDSFYHLVDHGMQLLSYVTRSRYVINNMATSSERLCL